jgi:hypothetical protein
MRQKISTFLLLTAVLAIGLFASMAVAQQKKEEAPIDAAGHDRFRVLY